MKYTKEETKIAKNGRLRKENKKVVKVYKYYLVETFYIYESKINEK